MTPPLRDAAAPAGENRGEGLEGRPAGSVHPHGIPARGPASTPAGAMAATDAALAVYRALGWRLFPCQPCAKRPIPPRGFHDATADAAIIARWLRQHSRANWAVATGAASGIVVIDIDAQHGGPQALAALEARLGPLPAGPRARTPHGGSHYFFAYPTDGRQVPCSVGRLGPGVDVRGDGGYVLLPPSRVRRADGSIGTYQWEAPLPPGGGPLPALPPAWLAALRAAPCTTRSVTGEDRDPGYGVEIDAIPEGRRNIFLAAVAGLLRRYGLAPAAVARGVAAVNTAVCAPPLADVEARRLALGMCRYPVGPTPRARVRRSQPPLAVEVRL
jgi:hypothetical protein